MGTGHKLISKAITRILRQGFHADGNVMHFIESTFSNPSRAELETIIKESTGDSEMLIELLLFPDTIMQADIEDIVEREIFQKEDEHEILRLISASGIETSLHLPGNSVISFTPPEHALRQFIERLNISKHIDARVIDSINRHIRDASEALAIKVTIRNSRVLMTEEKTAFLCRLFETLPDRDAGFPETVHFALAFLEEVNTGDDICQALANRKMVLAGVLHKASQFETKLKKYNIETLMLQGITNPCVDKEKTRRDIHMIDRICMGVFGRIENIGQPDMCLEMDVQQETSDKDILKSLN